MAIAIKSLTTALTVSNPVTVVTSESPSATQVGDLVVVIHGNDYYTLANMPTPTATGSPTITAITGGSADGGDPQAHVKSYTYVANTGGAQTISVTETGSADEEKFLAAYVLSGADTATRIDIAGGTADATAVDPWPIASISPTSSDAFLIGHANAAGGSNAGGSGTPPGGMAEQYDTTGGLAILVLGATQQLVASGATGTKTFDPVSNAAWAGVLIAVKTATAGGGSSGDAYQWTPRQFAGPVPRVFRTGIRAPIQLMGDKTTPFQGTDTTVTAVAIVTTTAMDAPTEQTGSTVAGVAIAVPVALPAPTVQTGSTVAATAVATSAALPAPALNTGSSVAATAIDTTTAIPAPTVVVPAVTDPHQFFPGRAPMFYDLGKATQVLGDRTSPTAASDATVSAVAIATTAALPAPALQTGSTVAATDVVTTSSLPTPTVQTGSVVSGVTVATTTAMSAPSVVAGAAADPVQFLPGRAPMFYDIGRATQLQGDSTVIHATVAVTVINTTTALPAPAISVPISADPYQAGPQVAGMFLAPELASFQLAGDASTGAPASSDATVAPLVVATLTALTAPAIQTGSTVSAISIATTTALPAPSIQTAGNATVSATTIATVVALPASTPSGSSTVVATTVVTTTLAPAPAIQTAGNSTVPATTVATVAALPVPGFSTGQRVNPPVVVTAIALPAPTVSGNVIISATTITTTVAMPPPSLHTGSTIAASVIGTMALVGAVVVAARAAEGTITGGSRRDGPGMTGSARNGNLTGGRR